MAVCYITGSLKPFVRGESVEIIVSGVVVKVAVKLDKFGQLTLGLQAPAVYIDVDVV